MEFGYPHTNEIDYFNFPASINETDLQTDHHVPIASNDFHFLSNMESSSLLPSPPPVLSPLHFSKSSINNPPSKKLASKPMSEQSSINKTSITNEETPKTFALGDSFMESFLSDEAFQKYLTESSDSNQQPHDERSMSAVPKSTLSSFSTLSAQVTRNSDSNQQPHDERSMSSPPSSLPPSAVPKRPLSPFSTLSAQVTQNCAPDTAENASRKRARLDKGSKNDGADDDMVESEVDSKEQYRRYLVNWNKNSHSRATQPLTEDQYAKYRKRNTVHSRTARARKREKEKSVDARVLELEQENRQLKEELARIKSYKMYLSDLTSMFPDRSVDNLKNEKN